MGDLDMKLFIVILIFLTSFSCSTGPSDLQGVDWPSSKRGVMANCGKLYLDTNVILRNENLERLIKRIETENLHESTRVADIPPVVARFLKTLTLDSFSISDANRKLKTEGVFFSEPVQKRRLIYLAKSETFTLFSYYKGKPSNDGFIVIVEHGPKMVSDFWCGPGRNLAYKDSILKQLKGKYQMNTDSIVF